MTTRLPQLCCLLLLAAIIAHADTPLLAVPKLTTPPTIDGKLDGDPAYDRMAALTGMVRFSGGGPVSLVPELQQVTWYLGYDDENLYLSMRSPLPEGTWPVARIKTRDQFLILRDDHTEIQFNPYGREYARTQGKGFYKIMTNPRGAMHDAWWYNGTPGTENAWDYNGDLVCQVTDEAWDMEMRVPFSSMDDVDNVDGTRWVTQLLRADSWGGSYFAGWVSGAWMAWDRFGEIAFTPDAPAFRLTDLGEITKGQMDVRMGVSGSPTAPAEVTIEVIVVDGNGEHRVQEVRTVELAPGESQDLRIQANPDLTNEGNMLQVRAGYRLRNEDGQWGEPRPLYRVDAPMVKLTDELWAQYIQPWIERRPEGEPDYRFAYWPSHGVAKVGVDVDFFGMAPEITNASAVRLLVREQNGRKVLADHREPLVKKAADTAIETGKLPVGDYEAVFQLLGPDGKKVVDEKTYPFIRRTYEWEGNDIGTAERVIPPFEPIRQEGNALNVWARRYELGGIGLPRDIVADGGAGPDSLFRAPMRIEARIGGKTMTVQGAAMTVTRATDARVELTGTGMLDDIPVALEAWFEYDGWFQVSIMLAQAAEVIDSMTIVCPLWDGADTIYAQRHSDRYSGNYFGGIPDGEDVVWSSTELFGVKDSSYVPNVFVGNGDKGLWVLTEDFRDWSADAETGAVAVARRDGGIDLELRLFAAPVNLDERGRKITFAILADPAKPTLDPLDPERHWRRMAWAHEGPYEGGYYHHDTRGYRYWGGSVDGYENTDADLEALNGFMTGAFECTWKQGKPVQGRFIKAREAGVPSVHYGSTTLTGLGLPAFDSYGGEWLGKTNWATEPDSSFKGRKNYQGTVTWDTPRKLTVVGANFVPSYEDCFIWYHKRLVEKTPTAGTWWDNSSLTQITDYDPARGEFYTRYNNFTRRRLMKRLCTAMDELGKPPLWINNMHVDWPFCQVSWHVENEFYIDSQFATMSDQLPVDTFRAMCRIKRGIIHRLAARSPQGPNLAMYTLRNRSIVGMCLLHDIGMYTWGGYAQERQQMTKVVDDAVGFFDGADFIGYWRAGGLTGIDTPGVYASVYRGEGRAVIVLLNENHDAVDVAWAPSPDLLGDGRQITRIIDGETGFSMGPHYNKKTRRQEWGEHFPGLIGLADRQVRLIVVE